MEPIVGWVDYDEKLNELRVANSKAVNEFVIYVSNTKILDRARYALLLADVDQTWARFSDLAHRPLHPRTPGTPLTDREIDVLRLIAWVTGTRRSRAGWISA